jgi:hypothetical protein
MRFVPITPRVHAALNAIPIAVLMGIMAPALLRGGVPESAAVVATAGVVNRRQWTCWRSSRGWRPLPHLAPHCGRSDVGVPDHTRSVCLPLAREGSCDPRFGPAVAAGDASIDGRAKRWTQVGSDRQPRLGKCSPRSSAIRLSSPECTLSSRGELSSWRYRSPPGGSGTQRKARDDNYAAERCSGSAASRARKSGR